MSAYAFSIDNFKRPSDEVAMLMKLAEEKLEELLHVSRPAVSTVQHPKTDMCSLLGLPMAVFFKVPQGVKLLIIYSTGARSCGEARRAS